ncbi:MAG: ABC transporter permease [Spirochaetales bacterium]|nr:ABC transporter permease [Spirochaetales bacterium]
MRDSYKLTKIKDFFAMFFSHRMGKWGFIIFCFFIFIALFAPLLRTVAPDASGDVSRILQSPDKISWLGTDDLARDIWSQVIYGSRVSLTIGFVTAFITVISGTFVGIVAGFKGGKVDEILMRIVDFFMMLPHLPLMIVLAAVMGASIWNIVIVISIVSWPSTARLVRSQVLSLKESAFVEAARCLGAGDATMMTKEILPNVIPVMFAQAVLMVTETIYSESVLSFLGLGDPTKISWGTMLHFCFESGAMSRSPWWVFPPVICIVALIISFSFLGTSISDILTPGYKETMGY